MKTIDINYLLMKQNKDTLETQEKITHLKLKNTFINQLSKYDQYLYSNASFLKSKKGFSLYVDKNQLIICIVQSEKTIKYKIDFTKSLITKNGSRLMETDYLTLTKNCRQLINYSLTHPLIIAKPVQTSGKSNNIYKKFTPLIPEDLIKTLSFSKMKSENVDVFINSLRDFTNCVKFENHTKDDNFTEMLTELKTFLMSLTELFSLKC